MKKDEYTKAYALMTEGNIKPKKGDEVFFRGFGVLSGVKTGNGKIVKIGSKTVSVKWDKVDRGVRFEEKDITEIDKKYMDQSGPNSWNYDFSRDVSDSIGPNPG